MSTFNGLPVLTITGVLSATPSVIASLPWNGTTRPYKWSITLAVTAQPQSSTSSRVKFLYNGQDVNVGQWVTNISNGLAYQIVSISAKTNTSVTCVIEDVFRYNTWRAPAKNGTATPTTGTYLIFKLSDDGSPMVDPIPSGAAVSFFPTLTSRFQYINEQYDFPLSQPGLTSITFVYGDVIATDESTQTYVLADSSHANVVGRVTAVDDTGTVFTINPIRKIVDSLDFLPGQVGDVIYTDLTDPGKLTATPGGTEVYLKLRNNTQSTVTSVSLASTTVPVTNTFSPPNYTFTVNGVLATVGGTGLAQDVVDAINSTSLTSGVSATLQTTPTINIICIAVDARPINLVDVLGSAMSDVGLVSVENGVKAAGMYITVSRKPPAFLQTYGFVYTQSVAGTTWTITHNANSEEVSATVYGTDNIQVIPDEILIVDINTLQISFTAPQDGKADLTIFI